MLSKYTKASGEIFESTEPSTSGVRTFTFSEKQDAIWIFVRYGNASKGSVNWLDSLASTLEIDGVEVVHSPSRTSRLLDMSAKEITLDPASASLRNYCWCKIIGLKK